MKLLFLILIIYGIISIPIMLIKVIRTWKIVTIILCLSILSPMIMPVYINKGRRKNEDRICFTKIRQLTCAIEMYNMDHNDMIHEITDETIETLVKEKYIEEKITGPVKECEYKSIGDICELDDKYGTVYCVHHGDIEGFIQCKHFEADKDNRMSQFCSKNDYYVMREKIREKRERKAFINNTIDEYFPKLLIGIIICLYISCFFDKAPSKYYKTDYKLH